MVILNLITVLPALGDEIVAGILGSSTVVSWSIRRFTVLHFLLGVIALALILGHLLLLHRTNPSRISSDIAADGTETLPIVIFKDLALFLIISTLLFWDGTKSLVHPDN